MSGSILGVEASELLFPQRPWLCMRQLSPAQEAGPLMAFTAPPEPPLLQSIPWRPNTDLSPLGPFLVAVGRGRAPASRRWHLQLPFSSQTNFQGRKYIHPSRHNSRIITSRPGRLRDSDWGLFRRTARGPTIVMSTG